MKTNLVLVLMSAVLLVGCDHSPSSPPPPPKTVSKKIILKVSPTEQRHSYDPWDKQSFRTRAKTVYYLVAEDGLAVEVGLSDFAKAKEGEQWTAYEYSWRRVP